MALLNQLVSLGSWREICLVAGPRAVLLVHPACAEQRQNRESRTRKPAIFQGTGPASQQHVASDRRPARNWSTAGATAHPLVFSCSFSGLRHRKNSSVSGDRKCSVELLCFQVRGGEATNPAPRQALRRMPPQKEPSPTQVLNNSRSAPRSAQDLLRGRLPRTSVTSLEARAGLKAPPTNPGT